MKLFLLKLSLLLFERSWGTGSSSGTSLSHVRSENDSSRSRFGEQNRLGWIRTKSGPSRPRLAARLSRLARSRTLIYELSWACLSSLVSGDNELAELRSNLFTSGVFSAALVPVSRSDGEDNWVLMLSESVEE